MLGRESIMDKDDYKSTETSAVPLKTSLNSPGGACKMKSEAILAW
jgi:hypothetical protein